MKTAIKLTSAESKRLIGKACAAWPSVQEAFHRGILVIARGTTNAYVVEELTGEKLDKASFSAGITIPTKTKVKRRSYEEYIFKHGERLEGVTSAEIALEMQRGDVFIKGGNALNYAQGVVGTLMGQSEGGTLRVYPLLQSRKIELVIPIGLEKECSTDLHKASELINAPGEEVQDLPTLFCLQGSIITEIEALQLLAGVDAVQIGAGGICGAEGAVWLMLRGEKDALDKAFSVLEEVFGEPPLELPPGE